MTKRGILLPALLPIIAASCVSSPPEPPDNAYDGLAGEKTSTLSGGYVLSAGSTQRYAREVTYRVRNLSCEGVASGSAFAVSPNLLVTNRHVVENSSASLELSTWDGRDLTVDIFKTTLLADLAFLQTSQELPVVARLGAKPAVDQKVAAVGYPLGGPWTLSAGDVVGYAAGSSYGLEHDVIVFDAAVAPGNSGGPLFSQDGSVVGVVFAKESGGARRGLAIPVEILSQVMASGELLVARGKC